MFSEQMNVAPPYTSVAEDELKNDSVLMALIAQRQPNAVIRIPDIPGILYLRTRTIKTEMRGGFGQVKKTPELGLYYDQTTQCLIDLEEREDGQILPTEFIFSTNTLRDRQLKKLTNRDGRATGDSGDW